MLYSSFVFGPNSIPIPGVKTSTKTRSVGQQSHLVPPTWLHLSADKRDVGFPSLVQPPAVASVPCPPISSDHLEIKFDAAHGVTFGSIGDSRVVRMALENGSSATLVLPGGMITSYKAPMWHGGILELLHTSVSEGNNGVVIEGGLSLSFDCTRDTAEPCWSPSDWAIRDVRGSPQDSVQVELICRDSERKAEIKHIVTLQQDVLSSELIVSNLSTLPLRLTGLVIGHLVISTPEAAYAVGLEGSNFVITPPVQSKFALIPPDHSKREHSEAGPNGRRWSPMWLKEAFLAGWGNRTGRDAKDAKSVVCQMVEGTEGEEDDNHKHLEAKMNRIYTNAPCSFTIMDRGRRNSVVVGREGFEEMYMFSPGASYEAYGKYSYVCLGPAALLKPILLGPQTDWRGAQHLHNPNL